MTSTARKGTRVAVTALTVGAATVGLSGIASASDHDHRDHDHGDRDHGRQDSRPGVLTGVGNLVGGVLASDLVGNVLDGVF